MGDAMSKDIIIIYQEMLHYNFLNKKEVLEKYSPEQLQSLLEQGLLRKVEISYTVKEVANF